jgi:hypothetical protein
LIAAVSNDAGQSALKEVNVFDTVIALHQVLML